MLQKRIEPARALTSNKEGIRNGALMDRLKIRRKGRKTKMGRETIAEGEDLWKVNGRNPKIGQKGTETTHPVMFVR